MSDFTLQNNGSTEQNSNLLGEEYEIDTYIPFNYDASYNIIEDDNEQPFNTRYYNSYTEHSYIFNYDDNDDADDTDIYLYHNYIYDRQNNNSNMIIRNLYQEFTDNIEIKKYPIYTIFMCLETSRELMQITECAICFEDFKLIDTVTLNCNHKFCTSCIKLTLQKYKKQDTGLDVPCCALCREPMKCFEVKSAETYEMINEHCN